MRRVLVLAFVPLAAIACKRPEARHRAAPAEAAETAAGQAMPAAAPAGAQLMRGKVAEKIDAGSYSYLRLSTASGDVWAAVDRTDRKVGDEVGVLDPMPMRNFPSKALHRTFELVYFGKIADAQAAAATLPPGHPDVGGAAAPAGAPDPAALAAQHRMAAVGPDVKVEKVAKASGAEGRTVAEVWKERKALQGKHVAVRGTVVKSTAVMGRHFLHLRDGTGDAGQQTNDLTVTTADEAAKGDVVTARGVVATDKDFGAGYTYPVLVQDAKVTK